MTVDEIKQAVRDGKTVHWANKSYRVIEDRIGQWLIKCDTNDHCIGLTWRDGVTLNGRPGEFFVIEHDRFDYTACTLHDNGTTCQGPDCTAPCHEEPTE